MFCHFFHIMKWTSVRFNTFDSVPVWIFPDVSQKSFVQEALALPRRILRTISYHGVSNEEVAGHWDVAVFSGNIPRTAQNICVLNVKEQIVVNVSFIDLIVHSYKLSQVHHFTQVEKFVNLTLQKECTKYWSATICIFLRIKSIFDKKALKNMSFS